MQMQITIFALSLLAVVSGFLAASDLVLAQASSDRRRGHRHLLRCVAYTLAAIALMNVGG